MNTPGPEETIAVGRGPELALLDQRFAEAGAGHGQVVLVTGEPGIGKTHLVRAFGDRLAAAGSPPIECWCSAHGANTPLGPFVRLLHQLAAPKATGSPALADLAALARRAALPADELVPLLAELLALPPAEPYAALELTPGAKRKRCWTFPPRCRNPCRRVSTAWEARRR